jgi:hypothetical protein
MWIFTRYGFFSAVMDKVDKEVIVVRSREKSHLENLKKRFPTLGGLKIATSRDTDYSFRIRVDRSVWSEVTENLAAEIDWTNFKSEVFDYQGQTKYEVALHSVWSVMAKTQPTPPYSGR